MSKELQVYVRGLPDTPGWLGFNEKQQETLQGLTSKFVVSFRQSGLQWIRASETLEEIEKFLEGGPMSFRDWQENVMPNALGINDRTAREMLKGYRQLKKITSAQGINYLAEEGIPGLNKSGINRILPVLEKNPAPKDPKQLPEWGEKIRQGVKKRYSDARKRKPKETDPEDAQKEAAVVVNRLINECGLKSSAEKRNWLAEWIGYLMQRQAIHGTLSAERTAPAENWWPRRGRPRNTGEEE